MPLIKRLAPLAFFYCLSYLTHSSPEQAKVFYLALSKELLALTPSRQYVLDRFCAAGPSLSNCRP